MKTSFKPLAYTLAASIALMSCNNVGEQNSQDGPGDNNSGIKTACKQFVILDYPDLDPDCRSEDRKLYRLRDEQEIEFEVDGEYYSNKDINWKERCSKGMYFKFEEATRDERDAYEERSKRCWELMNSKARDIAVPCELMYLGNDNDWLAYLMEEEVAELEKTYGNFSIYEVKTGPGVVDGVDGVLTDGDTEDCANSSL